VSTCCHTAKNIVSGRYIGIYPHEHNKNSEIEFPQGHVSDQEEKQETGWGGGRNIQSGETRTKKTSHVFPTLTPVRTHNHHPIIITVHSEFLSAYKGTRN